uniref:Uncharacterized protein n=1 Tax=Macrostomum lignano TaxID=282301 RepID=A0A1I8FLS7_9PLAT
MSLRVVVTGSNSLLLWRRHPEENFSPLQRHLRRLSPTAAHSAQTVRLGTSWTWQSLARMALPRTQFLFVLVDQ